MKNQLPSVLIISRQEQLRDSLRILLTSLPGIGFVVVESEVSTCLIGKEAVPPALVLLALNSSNVETETLDSLRQIKSTWPDARTAVLVEDERQYRFVQGVGVDRILFHGIIAAQLLKQIDDLLPSGDR